MARRARQSNGSGSSWIWYIVLIGIGLVVSPGASMVLAAGFLPTLVSIFVTTGPSATARLVTVATFNLAGLLPFVVNVAVGEQTAGEVLSDVFSWGVIMGAAGIGTGLNYFGPIFTSQMLTGMAAADQANLTKMRDRLVKEWGEGILKDEAPPSQGKRQ